MLLVAVGVLMILDRLEIMAFDLGDFIHTWWPIVLVIVGLDMVLGSRSGGDARSKMEE